MIVAFVMYSLVIGALAAVAAALLETGNSSYGRARRGVWIAAIVATVVLPPVATLLQEPTPPLTAPRIDSAPRTSVTSLITDPLRLPPLREVRAANWAADDVVAIGWALSSAGFLTFHVIGAWRLRRRARDWQPSNLHAQAIAVSHDIGPALYGWWQPRVVFPAWLLAAPATTQRLALAHEREHLAVRDPQVLAAVTLLIALMPWNAPLLWMLRRLRFAMEVDCDARVLRAGADPSDYGLALLFVSERQARAPIATMALIERPSQLERRINIMVSSPRRRAFVAGACVALAGSCVLAATQIEAPARVDDTPLKPVPTGGPGLRIGQSFERLLGTEYPELLEGKFEGRPVIVALVNDDFSIAKSDTAELPNPESQVDTGIFNRIGIPAEQVPYLAMSTIQLPNDPEKKIYAVYTEAPAKQGERFVSHLFPDTREIDRRLFERHFDVGIRSAMPAGHTPWVLLDRGGKVLRSGHEAIGEGDFRKTLESRYAGIRAQEVTNTALVDVNGNPMLDLRGGELHLVSVWLAAESPEPKN